MKELNRSQLAFLLLLLVAVLSAYGGMAYALAPFVKKGYPGAISLTALAATFGVAALAQLHHAAQRFKRFNEKWALLLEQRPKVG